MTTPPGAESPFAAPGAPDPADLPPMPRAEGAGGDRLEQQRERSQDALASLALVVGWFTLAGLLGAFVWVQVTTLPEFTRVAGNGSMGEEDLGRQFSISGWFLVIALVGGLVSGLVLILLRRRSNPLVLVVLIALGGGLATLLMVQCGLLWGPGDPNDALAVAQVGERVPVQLQVDVDAVYFAWSVAALLGATIALWQLDKRETRRRQQAEADVEAEADARYLP